MTMNEDEDLEDSMEEGEHKTTTLKINWSQTRDKLNMYSLEKLQRVASDRGVVGSDNKSDLILQLLLEMANRYKMDDAPIKAIMKQSGDPKATGKDDVTAKIYTRADLEALGRKDVYLIAKSRGLSVAGGKDDVISLILATGDVKPAEQLILEEAIGTWSSNEMKEYLSQMKLPNYGSKQVMTQRIVTNISIDQLSSISSYQYFPLQP